MTDERRRGRRAFLGATATAALATLAGCATGLGGGSPTASPASPSPESPPMTPVEGGTYVIGTDDGPRDARPAHEVTLEGFSIDTYEVTNASFAAFLNDLDVEPTGEAPPGRVERSDLSADAADRFVEGPEGAEQRPLVALDDEHSRIGIADGRFVVQSGYRDHPVNEVTWDGARAYADWRGVRLPTEAEWEAAARGFEGRRYPWGDEPPTHERAVYGQSSGETAPVGSHPAGATPSGIHDLAGNVSEWTSSLYRPYPYDADDGREDPTVRGERVTRGGAHVFFEPEQLRAYYRTGFSREVDRGHRHIGFRCANTASRPGR